MNAPDTDPRWQAPRAEGADSALPARRHDPLLVRIALILVLVIAVSIVFAPQRESEGAEAWVVRVVAAGGVAVACLGLLVPWRRISVLGRRLHPPGRQLASASRLLGWGALGALPAVALAAPWWANPIVASVPFGALALWRRRPWSVWYWYAAALAALVVGGWRVFGALQPVLQRTEGEPIGAYNSGRVGGGVAAGLTLIALAYVIARDTRAFQRSLRRG